jgi:PBSX family phage terminase large subunit
MFDGACNPEYPTHWLKQFIDRPDIDAYIQPYTIFDNPFLSPDFVENLCKEYAGTVYYDRLILGKWTLAEGLIYPMFRDVLEKPPKDVSPSDFALSIDYGTRNAFAALLWAKYGLVWYAIKGYYYSGRDTGINKTDEDYGHDMDDLVQPVVALLEPLGRKIRTIVDPSAASFITLLNRRKWCKIMHADNNVADGIRDTATAMQRGLFKVNPDIKEWQDEAQGYVWDDEKGIDAPVKENDHYMDSTRYFIRTMRLVKPVNTYRPMIY